MALGRRLPPIGTEHFSMVPRSDVPRSTFKTTHTHKTTFQAGFLIPIHVDEVLPGDAYIGDMSVFARIATQLFPVMDNLYLESFFFFVPNRLTWANFRKMMGEQASPADSISYVIPQCVSPGGGWAAFSVGDYMGLPTSGQLIGGLTFSANALPLRAYNLIYNEWFRDENLENWVGPLPPFGDGPDANASYVLRRRNKKHDYFTSALPWPQKGGASLAYLSGFANVLGIATQNSQTPTAGSPVGYKETGGGAASGWPGYYTLTPTGVLAFETATTGAAAAPLIRADLSTAAGNSINALRLAFTMQQYLEKDARGGTRYTEWLKAHFGVEPEDARLQRPEYIGGGKSVVQVSAVPQTSASGLTGGSTPQAALAAAATVAGKHSFSYHATEHGFIIGIVHVTADITYQQGVARFWTKQTRFDLYEPTMANLGEQVIYNHEIYAVGTGGGQLPTDPTIQDGQVFGYQERWAEYRHFPNRISGAFRSTYATPLDGWHLSQKFTALPALNQTFMEDNVPLARVLAAGAAADNMQVLFDSVFTLRRTRAMPKYSVPGLTRL